MFLYCVCRYRKVAYLDTDVGQPEFTAPGFLSLTVVDKLTPGIVYGLSLYIRVFMLEFFSKNCFL